MPWIKRSGDGMLNLEELKAWEAWNIAADSDFDEIRWKYDLFVSNFTQATVRLFEGNPARRTTTHVCSWRISEDSRNWQKAAKYVWIYEDGILQ